ncbi:MAG: hypothetical protein G01um101419_326 [Parcubacteria group bacterium Gr01-1014_19]|nr:MAG: hypothetical protein G01um101419_326 [Parcubacteria group bacterium Gr01-1014_19]
MGDNTCNARPCNYRKSDNEWGCGMIIMFFMVLITCLNSCEDNKRLKKMDERLEKVEIKLDEKKEIKKPEKAEEEK